MKVSEQILEIIKIQIINQDIIDISEHEFINLS